MSCNQKTGIGHPITVSFCHGQNYQMDVCVIAHNSFILVLTVSSEKTTTSEFISPHCIVPKNQKEPDDGASNSHQHHKLQFNMQACFA